MSMRHTVDQAVLALVTQAMAGHDVAGLEDGAERPRRVSQFGSVWVRDGDPGDPEIDICPPTYNYAHRVPVEIAAYQQSRKLRDVLDEMAGKIGAAVEADRYLGGLASYVEVTALEIAGISVVNSQTQLGGTFDIIVHYSTTSPL